VQNSVSNEDKTSGILVQEKKINLIFAVNLYIIILRCTLFALIYIFICKARWEFQHCTIGVISHCTVDMIWAEPSNSITELESFSILCTTLYFL